MALNLVPPAETSALNALRRAELLLNRSALRLATGQRINSAAEDPAGFIAAGRLDLAIESLEAESRVIERLQSNAAIADGQFDVLTSMTSELQGLLVQGANAGAMSPDEQAAIQMQIDGIVGSIQRFAGGAAEALQSVGLPDGGGAQAAEAITHAAASLASLATGGANSVGSGNFQAAQQVIANASTVFLETRGKVGAYQRYDLDARAAQNAASYEHLLAARSQIIDTDYAEEVGNMVRAKVLTKAGVSVLRISRQNAETVLDLLR